MTQLVITRGYPASGKSTWAKQQAQQADWARVCRDDLRQMLFGLDGGQLTHDQEHRVSIAEQAQVEALLKAGVNVVVDATHLRLRFARGWADLAVKLGAEFSVQDFPTEAEECIHRDAERFNAGGRFVGGARIEEMAAKFPISRWEKVTARAGEDGPRLVPYIPDVVLPSAFLVDMDGTLASMDGRRGPFEWDKVGGDSAVWPVLELVDQLSERHKIIIMSGRDECCRAQTVEWLIRFNVRHAELLMRPAGDNRKDAVVKAELFDKYVRHRYHVRGVLDDRLQVCRMWHSMGLPLFRVGDPDASF